MTIFFASNTPSPNPRRLSAHIFRVDRYDITDISKNGPIRYHRECRKKNAPGGDSTSYDKRTTYDQYDITENMPTSFESPHITFEAQYAERKRSSPISPRQQTGGHGTAIPLLDLPTPHDSPTCKKTPPADMIRPPAAQTDLMLPVSLPSGGGRPRSELQLLRDQSVAQNPGL